MNCKIRELNRVGLKNHHSTTTSHVRFVMKMAKLSRKSDAGLKPKSGTEKSASEVKMQSAITSLQKENKELKTYLQRLESKLDSVIAKNNLDTPSKVKRPRASMSGKDKTEDDDSVSK